MSFIKQCLFLIIAVAFSLAEDEAASTVAVPVSEKNASPVNKTSTAAEILSQENHIDSKGNFHWSFKSSDGSKSEQEGELKNEGNSTEEVVIGSFEYPGEGDRIYKVNYTADSRGYRAQGAHIPSVPPLIQRALDFLATLPVTTESPPS